MSDLNPNDEATKQGADLAGAPESSAAPAPGAAGSNELREARREAELNRERFLRAMADLENYRKRVIREKEEIRQFGAASLMESLLPVLDNLPLALDAARQQFGSGGVMEGVSMILGQLRGALQKHGLKDVSPESLLFDPALHECISHQPDPTAPSETVVKVVRPGYVLNGRLLRPASVVVSSGPSTNNQAK